MGVTSIILAEAPADYGQLTTMGVEDYVCDLTIILRNIVDGGRRRRSIEINKYRRSAHYKGEFPCTITTKGLAVFPLDAKDQVSYFVKHIAVPEIDDDAKGEASMQGFFDIGQGKYHVDWLIRDRSERLCSASWDSEALLPPKDKPIPLFLKPNEIAQSRTEPFLNDAVVRTSWVAHSGPLFGAPGSGSSPTLMWPTTSTSAVNTLPIVMAATSRRARSPTPRASA